MRKEKIAEAVVEIGANTTQLDRGLASAKHRVEGFGSSLRGMAGVLGLGISVGAVVQGVRSAVKEYANLVEARNRFAVVMGTQTDPMTEFLKDQKNLYGASRREAMTFIGDYAAMFRAAGLSEVEAAESAKRAYQLAGDTASFMNLKTDQANTLMQSYLMGISRAGYSMNVYTDQAAVAQRAMTMFGVASKDALTESQLMLARLDIAFQQAGAAGTIGDFERTMGSLSNQMKVASSSFADLKGNVGRLVSSFFDLEGWFEMVNGRIAELAGFTDTWGESINQVKILHAELAYSINAAVSSIIMGFRIVADAGKFLFTWKSNADTILEEYRNMMAAHEEELDEAVQRELELANERNKNLKEGLRVVKNTESGKRDEIKKTLQLLSGYAAWWAEAMRWANEASGKKPTALAAMPATAPAAVVAAVQTEKAAVMPATAPVSVAAASQAVNAAVASGNIAAAPAAVAASLQAEKASVAIGNIADAKRQADLDIKTTNNLLRSILTVAVKYATDTEGRNPFAFTY